MVKPLSITFLLAAALLCGCSFAPVAQAPAPVLPSHRNTAGGSENLFVGNDSGRITVYAPPYTSSPWATISSGAWFSSLTRVPASMMVNAAGDLFVLQAGPFDRTGSVVEYPPPYTSQHVVTAQGATAIALDSNGNLFVGGHGSVMEYAPPYTSAPITTIAQGLKRATSMAVDGNGNLFVGNAATGRSKPFVVEYAPPYSGPPVATFGLPHDPGEMAIDNTGAVIVGPVLRPGHVAKAILVFPPPYATHFFVPGSPELPSFVLDSKDDLFVTGFVKAYRDAGIHEYAPPRYRRAIGYFGNSFITGQIAIDGAGDVFLASDVAGAGCKGAMVREFAPPYKAGSVRARISKGICHPYALAVQP